MVAWLLKCNISRLFFMNFKKKKKKNVERIFLVFKTDFLYHQNAHFILYLRESFIFKYTSLHFFLWLQRSIGQPKVIFLHISKNHNKKTDKSPQKVMTPGSPT